MATKKTDLRELSDADLKEQLSEARVGFQKTKFNHAISPIDNPVVIREKRREIARLLTETTKRSKKQASK